MSDSLEQRDRTFEIYTISHLRKRTIHTRSETLLVVITSSCTLHSDEHDLVD